MGCVQSRCRGNEEDDFEMYIDPQRKSRFHKKEELPMLVIMEVDGPVLRDPEPASNPDVDQQDDYVQFPESTRKSPPEPENDLILDMVGITTLNVIDQHKGEIMGTAVLDTEGDDNDVTTDITSFDGEDDVTGEVLNQVATHAPTCYGEIIDDDDDVVTSLPELSSVCALLAIPINPDVTTLLFVKEDEGDDVMDEERCVAINIDDSGEKIVDDDCDDILSELSSESVFLFTDSDFDRYFPDDTVAMVPAGDMMMRMKDEGGIVGSQRENEEQVQVYDTTRVSQCARPKAGDAEMIDEVVMAARLSDEEDSVEKFLEKVVDAATSLIDRQMMTTSDRGRVGVNDVETDVKVADEGSGSRQLLKKYG